MKNKTRPVVRSVGGEGASPYGLLLLFVATVSFLGLAVFALSSSFGGKKERAPASVARSVSHPAARSAARSASRPAPREAQNSGKSMNYDFIGAKVEIQPFDAFCKKALARAPGDWSPMPVIDTPALVQALYEKKFMLLESAFADCQKAYEEGRITDIQIDPAHQVFANSDPRIDSLLTEWIGAYPKTPYSWIARARHRRSLAQYARGGKWAKDTPQINFRKMSYLLAMAQQDYVQAMDLNPRVSFAYTGMMRAVGLTGSNDSVKSIFSKGIANNPDSVVLWQVLMADVQPKWGGSFEEMDDVLAKALRALKNPEDVRRLKASYYEYKGDHALQIEKDKVAAMVFYKQMVNHQGLAHQYRWHAGESAKTLEEVFLYQKKALELDPFDLGSIRKMAKSLTIIGELDKALPYANLAVFLDSMESEALSMRGEIHEKMGNFDAAIEDFKNSLVYDPNSSVANMHLGHLLDAIKGRPEEAAPYLMQALLNDPQNPAVLYVLALNEETRQDCNVLKTSVAYVNACNRGTMTCAPYALQWARTVGQKMKSRGLCR